MMHCPRLTAPPTGHPQSQSRGAWGARLCAPMSCSASRRLPPPRELASRAPPGEKDQGAGSLTSSERGAGRRPGGGTSSRGQCPVPSQLCCSSRASFSCAPAPPLPSPGQAMEPSYPPPRDLGSNPTYSSCLKTDKPSTGHRSDYTNALGRLGNSEKPEGGVEPPGQRRGLPSRALCSPARRPVCKRSGIPVLTGCRGAGQSARGVCVTVGQGCTRSSRKCAHRAIPVHAPDRRLRVNS